MSSRSSKCIRRQGFTLVELMVVLAIIATLAAVMLPMVGRALDNGRQSTCMQSLRGASLKVMQAESLPLPLATGIVNPPPGDPPDETPPVFQPGCPYCNPPWAPGRKRPKPADPVSVAVEPDWMLDINRDFLCPESAPNPAAALDPKAQPARHSYGLLDSYRQDPHRGLHWVLADADVSLITTRSEVAFSRHKGRANIGRVDGSVFELKHGDPLWPSAATP
jgi:prepilin-type N-terminal cleavage/methylation domain-containing protein/prepilin-type processing-associated H-X9-DG protein